MTSISFDYTLSNLDKATKFYLTMSGYYNVVLICDFPDDTSTLPSPAITGQYTHPAEFRFRWISYRSAKAGIR
jgi:hypothetical protein